MVETITKRKIRITNRNNGTTGYQLQNGVLRQFANGQSMVLDFDEIDMLQNQPGGAYLLKNFFIIEDETALADLNIEVEPEYKYTEKEIKYLLSNEGTLDQLEDALNFAPEGVVELIKQIAVEDELPDTRKRKLITEKTGFSIDNAIMVKNVMAEDTPEEQEQSVERKATPVEVKTSARKTSGVTIK